MRLRDYVIMGPGAFKKGHPAERPGEPPDAPRTIWGDFWDPLKIRGDPKPPGPRADGPEIYPGRYLLEAL